MNEKFTHFETCEYILLTMIRFFGIIVINDTQKGIFNYESKLISAFSLTIVTSIGR